jgi:hypothetical protein
MMVTIDVIIMYDIINVMITADDIINAPSRLIHDLSAFWCATFDEYIQMAID